jgi:hypothetical protein
MNSVVLHVGAMKTGSSALQHALTHRPVRMATTGTSPASFEYVALAPWALVRGDQLRHVATLSGGGYACSATLPQIMQESPSRRSEPLRQLRELRDAGASPILSMETWLHEPRHVHGFTALIDAPVHVVAYLAPQVSWFNSLFWQRTHFSFDRGVDSYLKAHTPTADWASLLEIWRTAPGVERVSIRLKGPDIVTDFCGVLGCEPAERYRVVNPGHPGAFARYIHRWTLSHAGSWGTIKEVFNRWVSAHDPSGETFAALGPTPVVIGPVEIRRIVETYEEGNRRLLAWCEPEVADRIRSDPRWWSIDVHVTPASARTNVGRRVEPRDEDLRMLLHETDRLLEATLGALAKADEMCRAAERERIAAASALPVPRSIPD